ncbi:hypothetical protein HFK83_24210 [Ralstonia pseudosolanacearum]|uniref:hypothetical protein n=1 Tax=Ralstonia solanacearum species complex TaxID=3116862 RepID=UPI0020039482|nr:hypothetical protein [Ralstonia pseudosolanacearum]MCK4125459.1 hypothetical protein [Ralstonia pseudosolanacearum]
MSAGFLTSNDEWQALRSVDHLARDLYLALRRCMDFRTGVVGGPHKAISWQALREDVEVPGRPGVRSYRPSEQQLRRRVEQLEKCGLLCRIGSALTLQFRMLMARTDSCVQKKADRGATGQAKVMKRNGGAVEWGVRKTRSRAKADTHLDTGETIKPPTPPCGGLEGDSCEAHDPIAHVDADNPEVDAQHEHRLSEQRCRDAEAVGDGPAGRLAEDEDRERVEWSPVLAWPVGIRQDQRAAVAQRLAGLPHEQRQRVLDEWRGCCETMHVRHPWRLFSHLVEQAKQPGWLPDHADRVKAKREQARAVEAVVLMQRRRAAPDERGSEDVAGHIALARALVAKGRRQ